MMVCIFEDLIGNQTLKQNVHNLIQIVWDDLKCILIKFVVFLTGQNSPTGPPCKMVKWLT